MQLYECKFNARPLGAIGSESTFVRSVVAENEDSARLAMYAGYEHMNKFSATVSSQKWQFSKADPSLVIVWHSDDGEWGYNLKRGYKDLSALNAVDDPILRQKVSAECMDIVAPISKGHVVKVVCECGHYWITDVNGSRLTICNYFLDQLFGENKLKPTKVLFLIDGDF